MRKLERLTVLVAGLLFVPAAAADSPPDAVAHMVGRLVTVELTRDYTVMGVLLSRTDDRFLWLSAETIGVRLDSGFPWENVRTVVESDPDGGRLLRPPIRFESVPAPPIGPDLPPPLPPVLTDALSDIGLEAFAARVRSLSVAGVVANFDADATVDGLSVLLSPLDGGGHVVPVSGQVELRLIVACRRVPRRRSQLQDRQFREVGHWTIEVHPEDFTPEGAILELPFRQTDHENDAASPYALLRATLSVPGAGTFDAEDPAVPLRPTLLGPVPIDPQLQELRWR